MGRAKILAINVVTDSRRGVKGLQQVETAAARTQRRISAAGKVGGLALLALAAAGGKAAKAAAADESSQVKLASALRKNAGARAKDIASIEQWIDKTARAKGVADDELRPALAALARASGSVSKAQADLNLAMDVSAATGKPLAATSAAIAKGYGGNLTALSRLVPGIDKATLASKDMGKITDALNKKVGGDSARAANTSEGKLRRLSVTTGELEEKFGALLLPTLGVLVGVLGTTADFIDRNSTTVTILIAVIGALALATLAVNAAMRVYQAGLILVGVAQKAGVIVTGIQTAAQYALGTAWLAGRIAALTYAAAMRVLNAAMRANPLGLIITAITIVVGLFVLAYKRSATFRTIVQAVGRAGQAALGWIVEKGKDVVQWLGKLGPAAKKGKDIAVGAFKLYLKPIQLVIDLVSKLIGWIKKIKFPSIPKGLKSLAGKVGLGGPVGPQTPPAAPGGSAPGWGRGGPGGSGMTIPVGGGSGVTVNLNINGVGFDRRAAAKEIVELLNELGIGNGAIAV